VRVLITGALGFAGSHLTDQCLADGWEVHGTCVDAASRLGGRPGLTLHPADLRDADAVRAVVASVRPDRVFHLAAQASVAIAWADPAATLVDNLVMTLRVLDAVRHESPAARVLTVGSSEEYGSVDPACFPVVEDHPLRPVDPYGVSKVASDLLAQQHFLSFGTHVVRARPFNHIGPRQRRSFVLPDFAAGIVAIERGDAPPVLKVGNLNSARDFTDVRDVVRAYRLMLEYGEPGAAYNVCSGSTVRIGDMLDVLVGASRVPIRVELDPGLTRPIDRSATIGSFAALHAATGWSPEIPIAQSVLDTLAYWRSEQLTQAR
jgi:GDP-4-dehydro-6-deoxy-D-mannose reductase